MDRQSHLLRIICGQNIAKVARRYDNIDFLPQLHLSCFQEIAVRGEIVDDLRKKASPVDGIRAGKHHTIFRQGFLHRRVGKDALHAGLCIVEIALDGAHSDVFTLLGGHLGFLHRAHTVLRIEHHDLCPRHIAETLQSRLAGIAGGRHQDHRCLIRVDFLQGFRQQVRQKLERHVLKRTSRPVPKL